MDSVVAAGDIELAVRDYGGAGTPVLLIPGAGRTLADFGPLAGALVPDHRVVAMDLRNHGRSGDGSWTWDAVLGDVRAVVEHFEFDRPVIAGHSLGGMIAAMYLEKYGDLTAAVNIDGHGSGRPEHYDMDTAEVLRLREAMNAAQEQALEAMGQPQTADQIEAFKQQQLAMAEHSGLDADIALEGFDRTVLGNDDGTFSIRPVLARLREMLGELEQLDLPALYRRVPGPLLVYNATKEQSLPQAPPEMNALLAAYRRGLARVLGEVEADSPHVQIVTIDATHALIFEQPDLIAEQIREFILGATRRPASLPT